MHGHLNVKFVSLRNWILGKELFKTNQEGGCDISTSTNYPFPQKVVIY